jgi:plasmid stabilization system protein ParE
MALQIVWTPDAKIHLNEILEYWQARSGTSIYSQKLYQSVKNALPILAKYPESGKQTENLQIRAKIINYYLFYLYNSTHLYVLGFCDMRRDPEYIELLTK